jgi:hypothetical protein
LSHVGTIRDQGSRLDERRTVGTGHGALLNENNLSNQVTAGENRGKRLRHDFVVLQAFTIPYCR